MDKWIDGCYPGLQSQVLIANFCQAPMQKHNDNIRLYRSTDTEHNNNIYQISHPSYIKHHICTCVILRLQLQRNSGEKMNNVEE